MTSTPISIHRFIAGTPARSSSSRLPLPFLFSRLRYPGIFLGALIVILPVFTGETVIFELGFFSIQSEGVEYMLLVVMRFISILTVSIVIFGTSTFLTTVSTLHSMGIPSILTDMLMLTVRYIFEIADTLTRAQRAMRLRGFNMTRLDRRSASQLAGLMGSMLIRSYEQAERVYKAMRLRGYGAAQTEKSAIMTTIHNDYAASATALQLHD